jgi:hypothetical protein
MTRLAMNGYRAYLFLASAIVLLTGCELLVEFDRSKIDAGAEPVDGAAGSGGSAGGGGETAGEGDGGGLDDGAMGDAEVDGAIEPGVDGAVDAGDAGDAGEPEGFEVGGEVSGLASGNSVTLRINDSENVTVDADGSYAFPTLLADGTAYDVVVRNQPTNPNQTCSVANHDGTIDGEDVTDVDVTCVTNTYPVGGDVSGLASGNSVTLRINNSENVTVDANGSYAFSTALADGSGYDVVVHTQPTTPNQTCSVSNHDGTVAGVAVSNVNVNCVTNTYTVGGTVTGLTGTGLVLRNNGGDNLNVSADAGSDVDFTFDTEITDGLTYSVTVYTQPTSPVQTCNVSGGSGSGTIAGANVTSVTIICSTETYTVGGNVSGLATDNQVVLQNNGEDDEAVTDNGSFTFDTPLANGSEYLVTVLMDPTTPNQTCLVNNGSGTLAGANVANVDVTCTTNTYDVGGQVTGLEGSGLILRNNGGDDEAVTEDGPFVFGDGVTDGLTYDVTVSTQPSSPNQDCSVTNGYGTISGDAVTDVLVECVTQAHEVGGTVSGLEGSGLILQNNSGDDLEVYADGGSDVGFTFGDSVTEGDGYDVTVYQDPSSPDQDCEVTYGGIGTMGGDAVTDVLVECVTEQYAVGGTVSGLAGGESVTLQNNGGDDEAVTEDGSFTFSDAITDGLTYNVTVLTQPSTQTCTVTSHAGTLAGDAVTDVLVTCAADTYTVGGDVTGLVGTGLVLRLIDTHDEAVTDNSPYTFDTALADGTPYLVVVKTQPTDQYCTVANQSGTISGDAVTDADVTCGYSVGGNINVTSPPLGAWLVLQNNGGDDLSVPAGSTAFTFDVAYSDSSSYSVSVLTNPASHTCSIGGGTGSGTISSGNVTSVVVNCVPP